MHIVIITAIGVGGATIIGSLIGFIFKKSSQKFESIILSVAAGVMLATSVFNLIIPSLEYYNNVFMSFVCVLGIFCGSLCVNLLDLIVRKLIGPIEEKNMLYLNRNEQIHRVMLFVAAIAVHNFPEGIAAGVGFGTGNTADAITIAGSIALQNIPEGMVIIAPMLSVGISRFKTLMIAVFTGIIEVAGTMFGFFAVSLSNIILPFALAFAGGTMIYVVCGDMIPETQSNSNKQSSTYALITGFCIMLILDIII